MKALYSTFLATGFTCRIPSVSGKRYLKNPFGGHHMNDASRRWWEYEPEFCGDITDIDGYTHFDTWNHGATVKEKQQKAKIMCDALQKLFPRITEWEEVRFEDLFRADKIT